MLPFLERTSAAIVASNVDLSEEPELADQGDIVKYHVDYTMEGKRPVGIIGYVTMDTPVS